ncbi:MAG: hypothetical protein ACRETB_05870 [Steroidobacteraceae bacterium]
MTGAAIRRAREQDADFLAWAILAASRSHLSRGWLDIALSRPESQCLVGVRSYLDTSAEKVAEKPTATADKATHL